MITVTFLVPCYNVSGCVRRCVDSMLDTAVLDDIEILLINDGSTDNTSEVLHEYKKRYPSVVRVIDKANGGWGTVINLGIREAKGKYIKEVDADDWVRTENLKAYVSFLRQHEIDYVATEFTEYITPENRYDHKTYQTAIYGQTMTMDDFWSRYPEAWAFPIHAITYRTAFVRAINLTVGDRYYCDFEYFIYPQPYIRSLYVLPIDISVYFRGSNGQSTSRQGYSRHYRDMAALSLRLAHFYHTIPETLNARCKEHLFRTITGTIALSYELMMSPAYAGCTKGITAELKDYDSRLKDKSSAFYKAVGKMKKKGIPYILFWRNTRINLLKIKK